MSGKSPNREEPRILPVAAHFARCKLLIDQLFTDSDALTWGLSRTDFESALDRSVRKRFTTLPTGSEKLEEYLSTLHIKDLALASACANGLPEPWDYFVSTYRDYLRAAAAAILRRPADSPAARELADSLFAELYGLREGQRSERSLFRYFHGRSSLKTWLRAVLAQRHIDSIRAVRRFTDLDADDDEQPAANSASTPPAGPLLRDPHREHYLSLFTRALGAALEALDSRDKERLRLYYAEDQTLAEIGSRLGEHESSVSRNLERVRRELRAQVEELLRCGSVAVNGYPAQSALSEEQISLCFQYAAEPSAEGAPIDLDKLFARRNPQKPAGRQEK